MNKKSRIEPCCVLENGISSINDLVEQKYPKKIQNFLGEKKMNQSNSMQKGGESKENVAEKVFQKGNEHYQGGDLKKAEMAYSRALLYNPTDALRCTIVSNRCAGVKLGRFMEAKHDAEEAVRLNFCWGKAYFRLEMCSCV